MHVNRGRTQDGEIAWQLKMFCDQVHATGLFAGFVLVAAGLGCFFRSTGGWLRIATEAISSGFWISQCHAAATRASAAGDLCFFMMPVMPAATEHAVEQRGGEGQNAHKANQHRSINKSTQAGSFAVDGQ